MRKGMLVKDNAEMSSSFVPRPPKLSSNFVSAPLISAVVPDRSDSITLMSDHDRNEREKEMHT